jgi:hypothetical protein
MRAFNQYGYMSSDQLGTPQLAYGYDWTTGTYRNNEGGVVSWYDVKNNMFNLNSSNDTYALFQTAFRNENDQWVGTGKFGVIKEGLYKSTGLYPTFTVYSNALNFAAGMESGFGGSEGESLYIIGGSLNAAGFATGVGEYSNATNGMWKGANGKWYSTSWGGNQWTGARSKVMSKAGYFKVASRVFFYAGTLISGYQGFQAYQRGDYFGVAKSGLDITMGTIATFGGPPGLIIGGGYFLLDAFGTFDRTIMSTPYIQKMHAIPDNTYVAPSVNYP